ncbi:MAG: hypothetical protein HY044_02895 [Candidatus Woesebacteria bacterium]|nr:MAG: hypothetical protein HY044_02895 [Candidatus Woesebacteria bacterium]
MRKFQKIFISLLSVLVLGLMISSSQIYAQELKFEVNHIANGFEKIGEKITLFLKFSKTSKVDFYEYLAEKRLAEISYVIEANQIDSVEPTASRYSTYIGVLTNYVEANKVTSKKGDLVKMFERHSKILTNLQSKFKHDSGWWLAIQNDINNTKTFSEKIKTL